MSPNYSTKNGIRYRFYVSSALLRGRKDTAGSVARIPAAEIEDVVLDALKFCRQADATADASALFGLLERAVVGRTRLRITLVAADRPRQELTVPWAPQHKAAKPMMEGSGSSNHGRDESLIRSVVRAHAWMVLLQDGTYGSVEDLADTSNVHPKVVRQNLGLAFLSPEVTSVILSGSQPATLSLARIPKLLSLKWTDHRPLLD